MSGGSEKSVQGGFAALLDGEGGEQVTVRAGQEGEGGAVGFIGETAEFGTSDEIDNGLLDSGHPTCAELPSVPLYVESPHVAADEMNCGHAVCETQHRTVTMRADHRDAERPWDGAVDSGCGQSHQGDRVDSFVGSRNAERHRLEFG